MIAFIVLWCLILGASLGFLASFALVLLVEEATDTTLEGWVIAVVAIPFTAICSASVWTMVT